MALIYFRDKFVSADQPLVSVEDRSFRFGDGMFETLLVKNGRMFDFASHFTRLKNGLKAFDIKVDTKYLKKICEQLIQKNKVREGYVRIIVSRGVNGPGAIGYLPKDARSYFMVQTVEKLFPEFKRIKLCVASYRAHQPLPSKINNALHYTLSMIEAAKKKCDNAIILDTKGRVCETASGNLFWFKEDVLYTPSLDLPLVPGTIRKKILSLWKGKVKEGHFTLKDVLAADEVFMSNIGSIVAGIAAITPGKKFPNSVKTRKIRALLEVEIKAATR